LSIARANTPSTAAIAYSLCGRPDVTLIGTILATTRADALPTDSKAIAASSQNVTPRMFAHTAIMKMKAASDESANNSSANERIMT
jgi:hypothetical protein